MFDTKDVAKGLIGLVCAHRGKTVNTDGITDQKEYKEKQYDLLADCLRENLDIGAIYDVMSIKRM